jgi:hypothetical protein
MVLSTDVNFLRVRRVMSGLLIALVLPGCDPSREPPPEGSAQGKSSEPVASAALGNHGGGVTPACSDNDAIVPDTLEGTRRARLRAYTADTAFFPGQSQQSQQNAGNVEPENERLDCQSLIVRRGGKLVYDSLMTVWAFRALANANFPQPKAVAGIYYQGSAPYAPLRINPGRNCVFLEGDPKDGSLAAFVMPVSGANKCNNFDPAVAVKRGVFKMPNVSPAGPQKVARIVDTGGDYYIGLQCGKYWCVIGGEVGGPTPSSGLPSGGGDEQRLGYMVGGVLTPSELVGTLMPTYELFARKNASDYNGPFVTIAYILFTDTGPTADAARKYYANKWQLPGGNLPDLIEVKMRHNGSDFILKYGDGPDKIAKYVSLPGHSLRGIVRWRFLDSDETSWVQCPFGCCSPD